MPLLRTRRRLDAITEVHGLGVSAILFYASCGLYSIQPIGALPAGRTLLGHELDINGIGHGGAGQNCDGVACHEDHHRCPPRQIVRKREAEPQSQCTVNRRHDVSRWIHGRNQAFTYFAGASSNRRAQDSLQK